MPSAITDSTPLYSSDIANKGVEDNLNTVLVDNLDVSKLHIDAIFSKAKNNDQDSIEMLHALSCGINPDPEVAEYAQKLLLSSVLKEEKTENEIEVASSIRRQAQHILLSSTAFNNNENIDDTLLTNQYLSENPMVCFFAATAIMNDEDYLEDKIPNGVRERVGEIHKEIDFGVNSESFAWWDLEHTNYFDFEPFDVFMESFEE
ncbi:hypothetical protein [Shewanella surugensis]|uniref:Uncharacterized protein n=1 Tax=Shewanella surugensis TaxID=212020 RepID=A0ABT0LAM6_9GAMM|nr:hypothetical protein [Shewanella surugensis]MCL1124221.1 hypothetical protein [Shewanella surugensis]